MSPAGISRALGALAMLLMIALCAAGCSNEAEQVVETWEDLGELVEEHSQDCAALADELEAFGNEHGELFAADMRPIYDEIEANDDLRFRMERAFAVLESEDFECRNDADVQAAASKLFDDLLGIDTPTPKPEEESGTP